MVAATHGWCRQPAGVAGPMAGLARAPAPDLAPGELGARGHASPGPARLPAGPCLPMPAHCRAARVHGARLVGGGMRAVRGPRVRPGQRWQRVRPGRRERLKPPGAFGLARAPRCGIDVRQGQRWSQRNPRRGLSMPRPRRGALLRAARTLPMPQARQLHRVPRAPDEGTDDGAPGCARHGCQPLGPRPMPLRQGRLPVLALGGAMRQPGGPVTPGGPPRAHLGGGAKRAAQPATGRPGRPSLTILPSALAPRPRLPGARLAHVPPEASRLETLVDGEPRHPGRFPRHGLDLAGGQPLGHRIEVRGKGPERPPRLGLAVLGPTRPARLAADVPASGVRVDTGT